MVKPGSSRLRGRRGAVTVEMTLVGIPLIFILISIFEISRGMWMYHTAAHAANEGARFAIVHGVNCVTATGITNACTKTVADIALVVQNAGVGLDPATTNLTLTSPAPGGTAVTCTLTACASNATVWPPSGTNAVGTVIEVSITTPFRSALAMFWPGAANVRFGLVNLGAKSRDAIQF
jgi:Flp pilus assembly protein TadG